MQEIKCPNCGKVFQVDEAGYAQILQQVRDKEFQRELERRAQEIEQQKKNDLFIAQMEQDKSHREELSGKNRELAEKDRIIEQLQSQIANSKTQNQLAIHQAILAKGQYPEKKVGQRMQPGTILSDCQKPREGVGRATAPLAYVRIRRLCRQDRSMVLLAKSVHSGDSWLTASTFLENGFATISTR